MREIDNVYWRLCVKGKAQFVASSNSSSTQPMKGLCQRSKLQLNAQAEYSALLKGSPGRCAYAPVGNAM